MGIKGIIFIATAALGVILNFTARHISKRFNISELGIKLTALFIVFVSVILLFIFGK